MSAITGRLRDRIARGRQRAPGPSEPPGTPDGWVTAPPEFVGIGAQKAGTSWWNALIHRHPDVHRADGQPKELHFFDEYSDRPFGEADAERYARYFPRPAGGGTAGEWTPSYMVDFWAPALIARAAPKAHLLVILRDPVDRYRSSMVHTDAMSGAPLSRLDAMGAFQRGLYSQQLRRVFAAFRRDRVLILQYERCREDPATELARTFDFLGLRPFALEEAAFSESVNPSTGRPYELTPDLRADLAAAYAADLAALPELAPDIEIDRWPTARLSQAG